jgi:membrane protease YdiL (CAAX protease family)
MDARRLAGLALAVAAVLLTLPEWLDPLLGGHATLAGARRAMAAMFREPWPALPALVSLLLLLAVRILPRDERRPSPAATRRDWTAFAVGLLLLTEPLLHLGLLAWSGYQPTPASRDAVFPVPVIGRSAGQPWWSGALTILTLSLLVPVAEELFFRGRLLGWLVARWGARRFGTSAAVSLTTLAFAAAHGTPAQALVAVPLGLLLALIRLRTGDIGGCVLAHACHNSLFLFLGPMLPGLPWAAPLLALGGTILLAATWMHHAGPQVRWPQAKALAAVALAAAFILATMPLYRRLQDVLWVAAAHQVVLHWRADNDVLLQRLDWQSRRNRLTRARAGTLYERLLEQPCQRQAGGNPRQAQVLALLDPGRLAAAQSRASAYDTLLDLADCRVAWPALGECARRIGRTHPDDLASVAIVVPVALVQWFPLDERRNDCVAQLAASEGPYRRKLLAALERAFPGRVADLITALPAERLSPLDRRHLFAYYADAAERLERLARSDPARARALGAETP